MTQPEESPEATAGTNGESRESTAPPAPAAPGAKTAAVAEALALLNTLDERPLSQHPEVYQGAHTQLQRALAEIDDA